MKSLGKFKLILGLSIVTIVGLVSLNTYSTNKGIKSVYQKNVNVNITVDSDTTNDELDDINDMLKEHGITVKFSNTKRNDEGELTSIKIELRDENGNTAVSQTSSNMPIQTFSFGRKNGSLYVSQGKSHFGNFAFFGDDMDFDFNFNKDSIFKYHIQKLDSLGLGNMFIFDNENNVFSFSGRPFNMDELRQFDMDELRQKMEEMFIFEDENDTKKHQKFRFVDNPEVEKLIIIDGKESDFKTLDDLAKNDKLESVDVLKSKTAMSIYGKKAKDGAIIATTK